MVDEAKRPKLRVVPDQPDPVHSRAQPSKPIDIDRRRRERRENIAGRGRFDQYFNLYNLIYNSDYTTVEITEIFSEIMPDEHWQTRFVQEVSMDKMFRKPKTKDQLREFFLKHGVLEVHDNDEIHLPFSG